jgi:hypothetical protein
MPRTIGRLAALTIGLAGGVLFLEAAFRVIDGQPLTRFALAAGDVAQVKAATASPDLRYVDGVRLADGVDRAWYLQEPSARPRIPLDAQLSARAARYPTDPYTPFFVFNRHYLDSRLCGQRREPPGDLDDFFFFDGDGRQYPAYRHLPHISPPAWFVTNNFGWRGPDVDLNRPPNVVRIAFVGASTTVDSYSVPFSHPELVERWLNVWAATRAAGPRFEVINAGRTGIDSRSIAAIVRDELVPIDPDLVVFYEGANQFTPGALMHSPLRLVFPKPDATFRRRTSLERYSVLVRRVLSAWDRVRGGSGSEPPKPPASVTWPEGVDELAPAPHDPRLPMDLPQVVRDLDDMRSAVTASGGELVVSSFIWLAQAGMVLDLTRHAAIYKYLNDTLWPIPYQHVRRLADFQNRVFAAYARETGAPFIDIDRQFPRDPDLFDDPIHLTYGGLRLQGWMFLQAIVRIADERLRSGRWPRPVRAPATVHPAFQQPPRRLITRAAIAAQCS